MRSNANSNRTTQASGGTRVPRASVKERLVRDVKQVQVRIVIVVQIVQKLGNIVTSVTNARSRPNGSEPAFQLCFGQ